MAFAVNGPAPVTTGYTFFLGRPQLDIDSTPVECGRSRPEVKRYGPSLWVDRGWRSTRIPVSARTERVLPRL
jgi:hypothetical protein